MTDSERIERAIQLDTALQLFFFNVQRFNRERTSDHSNETTGKYQGLLDGLDTAAAGLDAKGHSLLRNLHRRLSRSGRFADPRWALEVLAESLFRGRDAQKEPAGSHSLLPRLLSNVLRGSPDEEDLRLLHGSLVLFLASLQDLLPYADMDFSLELAGVKAQCEDVLRWLRLGEDERLGADPSCVRYLFQSLDLEKGFCQKFCEVFHEEIGVIVRRIADEASRRGGVRLRLEIAVDPGIARYRALTHVQRLVLTLTNRLIDPVRIFEGEYCSKLRIELVENGPSAGRFVFHILTNFASPRETARLLSESRNTVAEASLLGAFGVTFGDWSTPVEAGYLAENRLHIPSGFSGLKGGAV